MVARELPTGLVTFLLSDIEGSTRLVTTLGPRYVELHAAHQRLIRAEVAGHAGVEVSTEGDSFFIVFTAATDAVAAAAEIQRAMAKARWPSDGIVRVRIGIHTGQGILGGDNYLGLDVHRAARIAAAGAGGQVLLSAETRDRVADSIPAGVALRDLGRHRLKDIGVEHLWQLAIDGIRSDFGPPRTLESHPTNLPREVTALIDREAPVAAIRQLIGASRLVTVTGPAGIGKSRVAVRAAADLVPALPDGVFYLDAASADATDTVADDLARLVDARTNPGGAAIDAILEHLRDRSLLLLIDNVDQVREAGRLIGRIVGTCREARVIVTSRTALRVSGERELPLGPLPLDGRPGDTPPAVALFVARAQAVRPDFALTPANAAAVRAICARVDGVPLAIELAAARARVLSPEAILSRLDRQLSLLTGGAADAPDRQRTLRAAIDWSYRLVAEPDQRALARLSVFAGPFDLAAAAAVGAVDDTGDSLDVVGRLVDQSLIVALAGEAEPRFRLLTPIREFAAEVLAASGEAETAQRAHADYAIAAAGKWAPLLEGERDLEAAGALEGLVEDARAAFAWLAGPSGDPNRALQLATALGRFWYISGRAREGRATLERGLAAVDAAAVQAPDPVLADATYWSGVLADEEQRPDEALRRLEQALELRRRGGDQRGIAQALNSLGVVARSVGDLGRAQALFEDSLRRKRASHETSDIATTVSNLGIVASDREDFATARMHFAEALALDERTGKQSSIAYSRLNLGGSEIWLGQIAEGVGHVRAALPVFVELGDAEVVAEGLELLADAAVATGQHARAARLILIAAALRTRSGAPLRPIDARRVDTTLAAATAALAPEAIAALRAEALAHDAASAVAVALDASIDPPAGDSAAATGLSPASVPSGG